MIGVCCTVLQLLQRVAVCCSMLQCVAVCCSVLQCVDRHVYTHSLIDVAVSVLQCVAILV